MESEAAKLRAELKRYTNLRAWNTDKKVEAALGQLIEETEQRLRELEHAKEGR